tara:strand:+ start:765 stop:1166 length:402 start_codon:yes stop_codon:yes gene_type:complete
MKPRDSYITALNEHLTSLETLSLRKAGYQLSAWTNDLSWEVGNPDETCWLIASEFGCTGQRSASGDYTDPTYQRIAMSLALCVVVRVVHDDETGDMKVTELGHDLPLREAMAVVNNDWPHEGPPRHVCRMTIN